MIEMKIENILASKIFTQKLILNLIATNSEEIEYKPQRLTGFCYVLKNHFMESCFLVFVNK